MISIDISKKLHGANGDMNLDVKIDINSGDFVAISGKSGSGKSTLLRIIAGLEDAKGLIKVDEEVWLRDNYSLCVQKRNIGFVFQDYALFENMSVEENLLFVKKDKELAKHLLEVTNLTKLKKRYPNALSGGQKQRVALCRAMMNRPKLLLMDEPLSALDEDMRYKLQDEIKYLHHEFKMTTFMVSHDKSEIYKLSSRLIELNDAKITYDGLPKLCIDSNLIEIKKQDDNYRAIFLINDIEVEVVLSKEEVYKLNPNL